MGNNKSYRIRTNVGGENSVNLQVNQDYDILEILSLKIDTENVYKLHSSKYGCVVGRVLANGGVGVPNAKISIFIEVNEETAEDDVLYNIYPYTTTSTKNADGIRYNLLPDEQITACHQQVGTFPNKRLVLDDKNVLEIFDTYYKYTTISNYAGDYMIFGVPVGNQSIHVDIDLSDIGFLSQKPIDMLYKGYNIGQFENAQQFKKDTNLSSLSQIISQNTNVFVNSFWGDEGEGEISITRHDIDVDYKFEPTCIFMGSLVTDNSSNGFSKVCVPTPKMGEMSELVTGSGTIEMIRKKMDGTVEEFAINGTQLIDGSGTWCYQIPMNLDYVITDEYGNLVPSDNPEKGLATRTKVRFRVSLSDFDSDYSNNHLVKMLVPNNPQLDKNGNLDPDYNFGTFTKDESFKDLLWNNVYTIKSFIPRIQKGNYQKTKKFSGIKNVNVHGQNSPIPYNNMRVNITFLFMLQCAIVKALFKMARFINKFTCFIYGLKCSDKKISEQDGAEKTRCVSFGDGLCPDAENFYYAPGCCSSLIGKTLSYLTEDNTSVDGASTDSKNSSADTNVCLTTKGDFFVQCVEINLAMENNVIQFDFYNDWINGLLYIPRWFVKIRKKGSFFFGLIDIKPKVSACNEEFGKVRRYTQQCAIDYSLTKNSTNIFSTNASYIGCVKNKNKCHKTGGRKQVDIFGSKGGIVNTVPNMHGLRVYYVKPSEKVGDGKCNLFATDIVLLGSISNENIWGIPNEFDGMVSSTYQMPPNLAHTNMDSDGVLYAMKDDTSRCTGVQQKEMKMVGNNDRGQTFEDYKKWAATEEFKAEEDVTEYAVTEISGIDWGFPGPNQGGNDGGKLYNPGGHFLGIACRNADVNIKSCINLSRICEIGSTMSQRQSEISKKNENEYEYEYIIPSGLISKLELSDTNYRTIFATLNHNRLKTVVNDKGITKYDFISVNPINYGGELSNVTNNDKYIAYREDNALSNSIYNANAYVKTIEDTSSDYYYYRLGINSENPTNVSSQEVKKHYLIKSGSKVALPVYENSYYFYFGLKDGSTALNRFMSDYYAACPNLNLKREAFISEVKVNDIVICNSGATAEVKLENVDLMIPYRVVLSKPGDILEQLTDDPQVNTNGFTIGEEKLRDVGTYEIILKNDKRGLSISRQFYVDAVLPSSNEYNLYDGSYNISFENMMLENNVVINDNKISIESMFNDMVETEDGTSVDNGGKIVLEIPDYDDKLKSPYPLGVIVTNGGYSAYKSILSESNGKVEGIINAYVEESEKLSNSTLLSNGNELFEVSKTGNKIKINVSTWDEGDYNVKIVYSCKKIEEITEETLGTYSIAKEYVEILYRPYSMYIYDETMRLDKLAKKGLIAWENYIKIDTTKPTSDKSFKQNFTRGEIKRKKKNRMVPLFIESSNVSENEKWKMKKTFIFDTSKYVRTSKNVTVGTINGVPSLKDLTHGNGVLFNEETGKYDVKTFYSISEAKDSGYELSKESLATATEGWFDNIVEFDPIGIDSIYKLVTYAAEEDSEESMPYFGNFSSLSYIEGEDNTENEDDDEENYIPEVGGGGGNGGNNPECPSEPYFCDSVESDEGCPDYECIIDENNGVEGCMIPGEGADSGCIMPGIDGSDDGCGYPGLDDSCSMMGEEDETPCDEGGEKDDDVPINCECPEEGDYNENCTCTVEGDDTICECPEDGESTACECTEEGDETTCDCSENGDNEEICGCIEEGDEECQCTEDGDDPLPCTCPDDGNGDDDCGVGETEQDDCGDGETEDYCDEGETESDCGEGETEDDCETGETETESECNEGETESECDNFEVDGELCLSFEEDDNECDEGETEGECLELETDGVCAEGETEDDDCETGETENSECECIEDGDDGCFDPGDESDDGGESL